MKLSYRGTTYNTAAATQVAVTDSTFVGHYRGCKVHFHNPVKVAQGSQHLTYRGIAY